MTMNKIYFLVLVTNAVASSGTILKNFGPYVANVTGEVCNGLKKNNITTSNVLFYHDPEGRSMFVGNITTFVSGGPVSIKRHLYKWDKNRYVQALPPTIYKHCDDAEQDFPLRNIRSLNGVCYVVKGDSTIDVDLNENVKYYMHDKFFYGKYKAVMEYYIKEGNILCLILYIDVNPA